MSNRDKKLTIVFVALSSAFFVTNSYFILKQLYWSCFFNIVSFGIFATSTMVLFGSYEAEFKDGGIVSDENLRD